jgi:hypothetical protein
VRDVIIDGYSVSTRAHLLPSRGPGGGPASAAIAVPSSHLSPASSTAGLSMAAAERSRAATIAALPSGASGERACQPPLVS